MTEEEKKAYKKQWNLDNKERVLEQQKQYYLDNKEEIQEYQKQYRLDNKEKLKAHKKQWHLDNKEKNMANNKNKYVKRTIGGKEYLTRGFWGNEDNGIHLIPSKHKIMSIGKKIKVIEYWAKKVSELEIGTDWDIATFHCWRCGVKNYKLELAHIVPKVLTTKKKISTSESEDNLVLLCKHCHREAPDVIDSSIMWNWIKRTTKRNYEEFKLEQISKEFENIYGEDLINDYMKNPEIVNEEFNQEKFIEGIEYNLKKKANSHAMEYVPSTWAWILKKAFANALMPEKNSKKNLNFW